MKFITILGRQSDIGVAEIEALYGPENIEPIGKIACFLNEKSDFRRLGSSIKQAEYLTTLDSTSIENALKVAESLINKNRRGKTGKLQLGISVYGLTTNPSLLKRLALGLKKQLRTSGLSVRLIPNKQNELNAAQVLRNKLTKENGFELLVIGDGNQIHLAKTSDVQDIDEYTRRDRDKPARDTLVGMLPPKLAQTLINLTGAQAGQHLLDPFCGTGTVLIEALNIGIKAHGSDLSAGMVSATTKNLAWFSSNRTLPDSSVNLGDATNFDWPDPIDCLASETYLGPAMRSLPQSNELTNIIETVDELHRKFLTNLAIQIKSGTKVVLAVPAWFDNQKYINLPMLDDLSELGYNPSSFEYVNNNHLVYHRPQQIVGRRILSLVRK